PALVPGVEVAIVLHALSYSAVLELEAQTQGNIQLLAVSLRAAAVDTHHTVSICKQVLQLGPEGAPRLLSQPADVGEGRFAALVVAGERAPPRHAPHGSLVEEFGERLHVSRVEGLVTPPD